ncbi:hypothetical protein PSCICF_36950 [Pseudomonas cichorii]|nr:hypothetical protein PSCICF_36950 [Pseudomonas cichorii]
MLASSMSRLIATDLIARVVMDWILCRPIRVVMTNTSNTLEKPAINLNFTDKFFMGRNQRITREEADVDVGVPG